MELNKLPSEVALEVKKLTEDEQFQKRFAEDKHLDTLQAQKHDRAIEFQQLMLAINKKNLIGGISFKPATLAMYSYLYCLQSNIVGDMSKITKDDLDIYFYLLQTRNYTTNIQQLISESNNYGERVLGLNYNEMIYVFNKLYSIQFKVRSLFPRNSNGSKIPQNVDWMVGVAAKIKPFVSYTTQQIYTQVSLSEIYYYFAHYLRMRGDNSIFIRSDEEILDEMDSRMIELVVQRLIQKKIIDSAKKDEYFDLMKKKREEKKDGC